MSDAPTQPLLNIFAAVNLTFQLSLDHPPSMLWKFLLREMVLESLHNCRSGVA